jgi:hypothetical protein
VVTFPPAPPALALTAELPPEPPATVTVIEATPFGTVQNCEFPVPTKPTVHTPPTQFVPGTIADAGARGPNNNVTALTRTIERTIALYRAPVAPQNEYRLDKRVRLD